MYFTFVNFDANLVIKRGAKMVRLVLIAVTSIAGIRELSIIWSGLERPLLEFITLGVIPGTAIQLSFEQILGMSICFFGLFFLVEHRTTVKRILRDIDLKSL